MATYRLGQPKKRLSYRYRKVTRGVIALALVAGLGWQVTLWQHSLGRNKNVSATASESTGGTLSLELTSLPPVKKIEAAKHPGLAVSTDPQLRKLAQYEARLGRGLDQMMLFVDIPNTREAALKEVDWVAPQLKEYADKGIRPLIIFEPTGVDLRTIDREVFKVYFEALKNRGISEEQIGTWAPFPEPNIPHWGIGQDKGNTDPKLFVKNVTAFGQELKGRYPDAQVAILLDSATYPNGDVDWEHPSYDPKDLQKYAAGFPKGLIDRVGLQGFPWMPKANEPTVPANLNPAVFLNADLAVALAKQTGVKDVWVNTGTFSSMYDWNPAWRVTMPLAKRQQILKGILSQAEEIKNADLNVSVVLFAEDKRTSEANWSYEQDAPAFKSLSDFVANASKKGMDTDLFDQP